MKEKVNLFHLAEKQLAEDLTKAKVARLAHLINCKQRIYEEEKRIDAEMRLVENAKNSVEMEAIRSRNPQSISSY